MAALLVGAVIGYIVYKVLLFRSTKIYRVLPRVQVKELAQKLLSEGKENIQLVDVRSHGYYDADAMRIKG